VILFPKLKVKTNKIKAVKGYYAETTMLVS
jgi:hypothetical protein